MFPAAQDASLQPLCQYAIQIITVLTYITTDRILHFVNSIYMES